MPRNYYIQWLNGSLIHGLWNLVFLFSNLSLIFLMPFAYFFTESEGFAGSRKVSRGYVCRQETEFHTHGSTEEILIKRLFAEV